MNLLWKKYRSTNSDYAHVKLPDGRETTVLIRHLAQQGDSAIDSYDLEHIDDNSNPLDPVAV